MGDFVPTVTRDSNGFLTLDWPTNQRSETMVAREVMVQMVDDLNRLRAELEQARLNLQHARTGKALLDLEREREERQLVEQSLIRTVVRLLMQNRDLRAHNERLEQRISNRRPDITIDVGVGTAIDTLRQINRHLNSIEELTLDRKDRHAETEP